MSSSMYGGKGPTGKWAGDKTPSGYKTAQLQQYTPGQLALHEQGLQNVGPESYLSKLAAGDQGIFNQIEAPAYQQFNEQIGGLASRFSGQGLGSRRSSGFQNATSAASSNFAQQLQANRMSLRQQAMKDLHGMSQELLQNRPYERSLVEKPLSAWQQAGIGFAGGAGQGIGNAATSWATGGA